jgi:hypothetical protein
MKRKRKAGRDTKASLPPAERAVRNRNLATGDTEIVWHWERSASLKEACDRLRLPADVLLARVGRIRRRGKNLKELT